MPVLALDTTTAAGSVAIVEDDRVLAERIGDPARSHTARLPGDILLALDGCDLAISDIDLFAIASGPGSFTGLRTGIATIQGLAVVNHKRVVPVSALTALATAANLEESPGRIVGAWMDAHRHDVFSALFRTTARRAFEDGGLIEIEAPAVGDPIATLTRWQAIGCVPDLLVGDGAALFASSVPPGIRILGQLPLAAAIGRIALTRARLGGTVDAAAVQPLYIRRPDVELARDALHRSSTA